MLISSCCQHGETCRSRKREEHGPLSPKLWPRLKLESSGLSFGQSQLARLNSRLAAMLQAETLSGEQGAGVERARGAAEQAVERLVQRLVCAVGELDPRFSSKFLVTFDSRSERALQTEWPGRRFRYLVRLDALSWPPLYPEGNEESAETTDSVSPSCAVDGDEAGALPAGWVRVKPSQGAHAQVWAEFLAPSGCLRRDRIVEKFASLLSQAAVAPSAPNSETDESRVCGAPGKVLDAGLLQTLLSEVSPEHQLFYGPSEAQRCRPPDPRDFQLAVLHEGGSGPVLLRVGLLSPSLQAALPAQDAPPVIEVSLHVGVALGGWPSDPGTFPARLPLHHPLALLAYKSAQQGYYAVAVGPPASLRCEERRSAWQARFPGAAVQLDAHFSSASTPRRVLTALRLLTRQIEPQINEDEAEDGGGLHTVRDSVLRSLVRRQLEKYESMDAWEPASLAAHVLLCLDGLLASLRTRHAPNFFIPDANLLLQPQGPASNNDSILPHAAAPQDQEEAWEMAICEDSHAVYECLTRLYVATRHENDQMGTLHAEWGVGSDDEQRGAALEAALLARWRSALHTVSPPPPAPSTSLLARITGRGKNCTAPRPENFSPRQLDYIAQVVRELVRFRRATLQHQPRRGPALLTEDDDVPLDEGPTEDFLFLLDAVLEQALGSSGSLSSQRSNKRKANSTRGRHRKDFDRQQAWRESVTEAVRREPLPRGNAEVVLVRYLLQWLWSAATSAPGQLGRRLARFLASTWAASRDSAWHLPEWRHRNEEVAAEMNALAAFCSMLLASQEGWTGVAVLRDAADKGWRWARSAQAELARSGSLQLVLAPSLGVVRRCDVALALQPSNNEPHRDRAKTLPARYRQPNISQEELTMRLGRGTTTTWQETSGPSHLRLRDGSPMSAGLDSRRRYGQQHALGNLVNAFIAMHRISVLQEVAALLPSTERQPVLDALQRLSRARRLTRARRAAEEESSKKRRDSSEHGRYTAWDAEFPSVATRPTPPVSVSASSATSSEQESSGGILGSCRVARKLQRRHTLFSAFPGERSLAMLHSTSPASVRRRYNTGAAVAAGRRPAVALLQLGDSGEITLKPESRDAEPPMPINRTVTKF